VSLEASPIRRNFSNSPLLYCSSLSNVGLFIIYYSLKKLIVMKTITMKIESSVQHNSEDYLTTLSYKRTNGQFGKRGFPTKYYAWGSQITAETMEIDLADYNVQHHYKLKEFDGVQKICCFKVLEDINDPIAEIMPAKTQAELRMMPEFAEYFAKLDGAEKTPF